MNNRALARHIPLAAEGLGAFGRETPKVISPAECAHIYNWQILSIENARRDDESQQKTKHK